MINGVIKAPESPQTDGFTPTMMNDIKAADPTAKINLITPPTANNRGFRQPAVWLRDAPCPQWHGTVLRYSVQQ